MIQLIFLKLNSKQKLFFTIVVMILLFWFSFLIWDLLVPVFFALFMSYILTPVVDKLTVFFKFRLLAILFLYFFFVIFLMMSWQFLVPPVVSEFNDLSSQIPTYFDQFQLWLNETLSNIQTQFPFIDRMDLTQNFEFNYQTVIIQTFQSIPTLFLSTFSFISGTLFILLLMFFFLLQGKAIWNELLKFIPNRYFELFVKLFYSTGNQLSAYISGIFMESVVISILTTIVLMMLSSEYSVLLGVLAGLTNVIPYVGPIIAAVPAVVIFYLKMSSFNAVIVIILGYVVVQMIDNVILKPLIFSRSVNLPPLVVFLGLIIGGMLGKVWGLILAVPIMGCIKVFLEIFLKEINFRLQFK